MHLKWSFGSHCFYAAIVFRFRDGDVLFITNAIYGQNINNNDHTSYEKMKQILFLSLRFLLCFGKMDFHLNLIPALCFEQCLVGILSLPAKLEFLLAQDYSRFV